MTSGDKNQSERSHDEIIAGEYVLGVLSLDARRRVEVRMASDRAFAGLVERWQADLETFDEGHEDVAPDPALFGIIERRLFGVQPPVAQPSGLWHIASFWRWLSLGTSAIAAGALVYAAGTFSPAENTPSMVAQLTAPDSHIALVAAFDAHNGRMRMMPMAGGEANSKSLQLWLLGGGDPRSLGVFEPGMDGEMVIAPEMRASLSDGAVLAVSLEPPGGSPTGLPTGPVIASGSVRRL